MTNAEKFKDIFGVSIYTVASICKGEYMACEFCKNDTCTAQWWNSECKESTTKNDLVVDCISRQAVLDLIADYDLSMGQVVKGIHALPSVTPQEPDLDKLRAEIENINVWGMRYNPDTDKDIKPQIVQKVKEHVIEIIDKYKAEIEPQESEG